MSYGGIMNKRSLAIIEKLFIRDPWKKAEFYKKHNYFHHIGEKCYIAPHISPNEGYLISIGDNVWITSGVQFINHDASVQVVQKVRDYHGIDKVGIIDIGNNVFIGNNSIILPGVKIGSNCVVGAGSVVTGSIPANSVAAGNPAQVISTFDEYADKCIAHSDAYPWLWAATQDDVRKIREKYFWEEGNLK